MDVTANSTLNMLDAAIIAEAENATTIVPPADALSNLSVGSIGVAVVIFVHAAALVYWIIHLLRSQPVGAIAGLGTRGAGGGGGGGLLSSSLHALGIGSGGSSASSSLRRSVTGGGSTSRSGQYSALSMRDDIDSVEMGVLTARSSSASSSPPPNRATTATPGGLLGATTIDSPRGQPQQLQLQHTANAATNEHHQQPFVYVPVALRRDTSF
eukprot:gnl/Spiro4/24623_TR12223_c0_g1_i1.p1 gnl/Spiro4/24623_TR12223_c0_g1~~gnl/Spiro4/24623_TR12223_c0_g1_i1.p1  ORF type:complete len:212 (+),score=34.45 gnl/Spiro4/24623_TR12223_c0_g1_i1:80-715(+)